MWFVLLFVTNNRPPLLYLVVSLASLISHCCMHYSLLYTGLRSFILTIFYSFCLCPYQSLFSTVLLMWFVLLFVTNSIPPLLRLEHLVVSSASLISHCYMHYSLLSTGLRSFILTVFYRFCLCPYQNLFSMVLLMWFVLLFVTNSRPPLLYPEHLVASSASLISYGYMHYSLLHIGLYVIYFYCFLLDLSEFVFFGFIDVVCLVACFLLALKHPDLFLGQDEYEMSDVET